MPEVQVRYKSNVPSIMVDHLCRDVLPKEVAAALHTPDMPEARLSSANIQVWADPVGLFDVQSVDVAVIVDANDYPPRRAKLEIAKEHLLNKIDEALTTRESKFSSNIKVRLTLGAFGESK